MAKSGGKKKDGKDGKRAKEKRPGDGKAAVIALKDAKSSGKGAGKARDKAVKGKALKAKALTEKALSDPRLLVEQVAAEIVAAEHDRAVKARHEPDPAGGDGGGAKPHEPLGELLRVRPGPVDLAAWEPAATPGVGSREQAQSELASLAQRLDDLQERLFAAARGGDSKNRVLLLLQGMDTSGKGGSVRHVIGGLDPNGVRLTAFKAPTEEELAHDFLWRVRRAAPQPGEVGIFDRSQYEDVLIARVRKLALPMVIGRRYSLINKFEQELAADGCTLVKVFLHISQDEQRRRLLARLDEPAKHWKYNPGDVDERALWPQYQEAYRIALEKCSTGDAPWYVVPADHKWYRNYAITRLLVEALERIDPVYPPGHFDVDVERARVLAS